MDNVEFALVWVIKHNHYGEIWFDKWNEMIDTLKWMVEFASDALENCDYVSPNDEPEDTFSIEAHVKPVGYVDALPAIDFADFF